MITIFSKKILFYLMNKFIDPQFIFVRVFFADYPVQMTWTSHNFYELYIYKYIRKYIGAYKKECIVNERKQ